MTRNRFVQVCAKHGVDPAIALENDDVCRALVASAQYPESMRADADAMVEDVIAGAF